MGSKCPVSLCLIALALIITTSLAASSHSRKLKIKELHEMDKYSHRELTKHDRIIDHDPSTCNLNQTLIDEIKGYQEIIDRIIEAATEGAWKGRTYENLTIFVDKFGHRLSGTQTLEDSIDYVLEKMSQDELETHGEEAIVPHWVRGEEVATLLEPRVKNLALLGLGTSVGTSEEGITADVLVVTSFEDLTAKAANVSGKIVVYNQEWTTYGASVQYRTKGATEAAKFDAVAALIRSIAPFSLDTPHTGGNNYDDNVKQIPAACITIEDAELMYRMQESGEKLRINLKMLDYNLPFTTSKNGIGELIGTEIPDEAVILSGHIDSWDVGQGAMDDGGGCAISWEALSLLKHLELVPKRTVRAIMWTSEEPGLWGGLDYARHHKDEADKIIAAFESDAGTFTPRGLDFAGSEEAGCIIYEILKLFESINATDYAMFDSVSTDISHLIELGVPGLENKNANENYFWYHHTEGDTMTMMNSDDLDLNLALWAGTAYVIANLTEPLPRREVTYLN